MKPGALQAASGAAVGSRSAILELPGNMAGPFFSEKLDFGRNFGPQWILKGVAKATFWSIMFEKTRKRRSRNGSRKNMNFRWIFDAKMGALHM